MKFSGRDKDAFVFHLSSREKVLFLDLLKFYPAIPAAHHQVSKSGSREDFDEHQKLLNDAIAEQRRENKQQLQQMLTDPERFTAEKLGFQFRVSGPQIEWLLQVINDIRVGSWLAVGSPDPKSDKPVELSRENARHFWAMELAGYFQAVFLEALET